MNKRTSTYNNQPFNPKQMDEKSNRRIIAILKTGPQHVTTIAKQMKQSHNIVQARLYRMEARDEVMREPVKDGVHRRWGLPGEWREEKADKSHVTPPRRLPDWRTSNLNRDPFAHMKIALLTRS